MFHVWLSQAILEEWGTGRDRGRLFRQQEKRRRFVVVKVLGDEAEIHTTKVGGQIRLEGELAGEDAANEIGYVACCALCVVKEKIPLAQ